MNLPNILNNVAAMAIPRRAATELGAIGAHCVISPLSLPKGMTAALHVGAGCGGELANAAEKSDEVASKVTYTIEDAARLETADRPH
jgi:hypothetical protein